MSYYLYHYHSIRLIKRLFWKLKPPTEEQVLNTLDKWGSFYPSVATIDETIDELTNNRRSIVRFGDGEFMLCFNRSIGFQKKDNTLRKRLISILNSENENCLIAIPQFSKSELTQFWKRFWFENVKALGKLTNRNTVYFNQGISRQLNLEQIEKLKSVWNGRNIVFVTGRSSRFNVEHELFKEIKSNKCYFGPSENAWANYPVLLKNIKEITKNIEDPLVICALGPTATVLCYDLSEIGIQALDIGHLTNIFDVLVHGAKKPELI